MEENKDIETISNYHCPFCDSDDATMTKGDGLHIFGQYGLTFKCDSCNEQVNIAARDEKQCEMNFNDFVFEKRKINFTLYIDEERTIPATCPLKNNYCSYDCSMAMPFGDSHNLSVYSCGLTDYFANKFLYSK